jgi:hypothetical protein
MYKISKTGFGDSYICEVNHIAPLKKYVRDVQNIARTCSSLCLEVDISAIAKDAVESSFTPRDVFAPLASRLSCASYQTLTAGKSDTTKAFLDKLTIDDACIIYAQCMMIEELSAAVKTLAAIRDDDGPTTDDNRHLDQDTNRKQGERMLPLETLEAALWNSPHFLRKRGLEKTVNHVKMSCDVLRGLFAPPLTKNGCTLDNEKDAAIVDAYVHELQEKVHNMIAYLQNHMACIEDGNKDSIFKFLSPDRVCAGPDNEQTIWRRNVHMADALYDEIVVNHGNVFAALGMLHTHDHASNDVNGSVHQQSVLTHMRNKGFIVERVLNNVFFGIR